MAITDVVSLQSQSLRGVLLYFRKKRTLDLRNSQVHTLLVSGAGHVSVIELLVTLLYCLATVCDDCNLLCECVCVCVSVCNRFVCELCSVSVSNGMEQSLKGPCLI